MSRPTSAASRCLARYLTGQILGQLFGQAAGGVLGDLLGWRNVFFVLAAMFALATVALVLELLDQSVDARARPAPDETSRGFVADYVAVLSNRWARIVILAVFIEASVGWGAFAYVGADLHLRFGLSFSAVGLIVGTFGIGGLLYAASVQPLVNLLGQQGLAIGGGALLGLAYLILAIGAAVVAGADRGDRDRARLLCAAQHAADQRDPDDAAGARNRGRDLLVGDLSRPDAGRRGGGAACSTGSPAVPLFLFTACALPLLALVVRARAQASDAVRSAVRLASAQPRPRETRSISARTSRSTMPGRLSSSQVLSIGRSISRTRSSSVRPFCTSTVCASVLKAEIDRGGGRGRHQSRSLVALRRIAGARASSARRRAGSRCGLSSNISPEWPSMVRKPGAGTGAAICSVRSRMSEAGSSAGCRLLCGGNLQLCNHRVELCLLRRRVVAARRGGGAADGGAAAWRPSRHVAGGAAGSVAFGGLLVASSSAMIRRMEARISSIEGSCAFAG